MCNEIPGLEVLQDLQQQLVDKIQADLDKAL